MKSYKYGAQPSDHVSSPEVSDVKWKAWDKNYPKHFTFVFTRLAYNAKEQGSLLLKIPREYCEVEIYMKGIVMKQSVYETTPVVTRLIEGHIGWMYLDIKGNVTIGDGILIDPLQTLLSKNLPLVNRFTGHTATQDEIVMEWRRMKLHQNLAHQGAQAAKGIATLSLSEGYLLMLDQMMMRQFDGELPHIFPDYEAWPADAQLAVMLMSWAMGTGKFISHFPLFTEACREQNWMIAARQCYINTTNNPGLIPRNHIVHALLICADDVQDEPEEYNAEEIHITDFAHFIKDRTDVVVPSDS